jgi:hypothetical protein
MADTSKLASSIGVAVPNAARMYDYWLGGRSL